MTLLNDSETEPETDDENTDDENTDTETCTEAGTGTEAEAATDTEAATDPESEPTRPPRPAARLRKAVVPVAVTALLLAGGAFFHGAHQLRSTPSARNQALTDTAATHRVGGDVSEGLARIFSYTPTSSDAAERSAGTFLAGRAARQYSDLFAQVRKSLVQQRITLSTQAVRTGVIELHGDTARLLVFLDQVSRRDKGPATSAAAQLTVTARFQDDRWQITDIKAR
ncbi:hypothetical protein [Streptomyces sp. NPDC056049]|uniref:hypothetical protein n=1 Tax=Streptomyces sp. NPDC056049 TaxID=3345693 RepID=UPI0035DCC2C3